MKISIRIALHSQQEKSLFSLRALNFRPFSPGSEFSPWTETHWREKRNDLAKAHLQIAPVAVRCVEQRAHFELFKVQPQHPVTGRAAEAPEPVPARQRSVTVEIGHLGRGHILVDVDRFIAVVLARVGVTAWKLEKRGRKKVVKSWEETPSISELVPPEYQWFPRG